MFCPKCRTEYRKGFTTCADCEIPLVAQLPSEPSPAPESEYIDYEEILATHSPADVVFLKSLLDSENITYFFQGEHVAPYVYYGLPMRLLVKKDQVEKTIELLKDFKTRFGVDTSHTDDNEGE